jgi:hypothetical protein
MPTKWVIETDLIFLEPAVRFAQLNPNSIRVSPGQSVVGSLSYPSPFCQSSLDWMRALSHLVARDREFSLFLVNTRSENDPTELSRDRIFPILDPETLDLLRQINRSGTSDLETQSRRVSDALDRLRVRAKLSLGEELSELCSRSSDS